MLASLSQVLAESGSARAVAAATCYDLETALGVRAAAGERGVPLTFLIAAKAFDAPDGAALLSALCAVAGEAEFSICVQLDHCSNLRLIERAFELGATAAMADGSELSYDENVALAREAVAIAAQYGASIEAELGRVEGGEDVAATTAAGALTDPAEAESFCASTGVACLAVSIGNVHGHYAAPAVLDWERLAAIRSRVGVPLSLHGASGLSPVDLHHAVSGGITKVNTNTELREAYLAATERELASTLAGARLLDLHAAQRAAVAVVCGRTLDHLEGRSHG